MVLIIKMMLVAALAYLAGLFLPWWGVVVAAGLVSFVIPTSSFSALVSGFVGVGVLWLTLSWKIQIESKGVLSERIAAVFTVDDPIILVIASGFVGAVCGGLGALTGNSLRQIFQKKKSKSLYS